MHWKVTNYLPKRMNKNMFFDIFTNLFVFQNEEHHKSIEHIFGITH